MTAIVIPMEPKPTDVMLPDNVTANVTYKDLNAPNALTFIMAFQTVRPTVSYRGRHKRLELFSRFQTVDAISKVQSA